MVYNIIIINGMLSISLSLSRSVDLRSGDFRKFKFLRSRFLGVETLGSRVLAFRYSCSIVINTID